MQRWRSILKGKWRCVRALVDFNPTKRTHNPITLNYTHQEKYVWIVEYDWLWLYQFEQNLPQYKLYKQLDKDKW